jgi:membrane-associated phospholipid phosphatase
MSDDVALLIGNSSFPAETKLASLRFPDNDVDCLAEVLTSREHGIFEPARMVVLKNQASQDVRQRLNEALKEAGPRDLVLVYYAGHGKLNRLGELHLATRDTRLAALEATAVAASELRRFIDVSSSRRIVVLLDCCYSGAIAGSFTRGAADDPLQRFASGRGIHLMTASTSIQVAHELERDGHGIFTKHLLAGLRGAADLNADGVVSVDELYSYVHDRVVEDGSQEPTMLNIEKAGELFLARSGSKPREERNRQIEARLFAFADQRVITRLQALRLAKLVETPPEQLDGTQRQQVRLIDDWMLDKMTLGELMVKLTRIRPDSAPLQPLPADSSTPPGGSADGGPGKARRDERPPLSSSAASTPPPGAGRPPEQPGLPAPPGASTPTPPSAPPAERPLEQGRSEQVARSSAGPRPVDRRRRLVDVLVGRLRHPSWRGIHGSKPAFVLLLAAVFAINYVETTAETRLQASFAGLGRGWRAVAEDLALASSELEARLLPGGALSFLTHDKAPDTTVFAYTASYFIVFPLLCLATAVALYGRREIGPFRVYALALACDYALSLPFFLVLPVPERWAHPGSGAVLLSDRVSSALIDYLRPISGIDNCFPSFHTSMTVITVAVCFLFRARLRLAVLGLGATVVLSTVVLGIHWLGDVVAGAAAASLSVAVAVYLDARFAAAGAPAPAMATA